MQRRHFVKLSASGLAGALLSSITSAAGANQLLNIPDEVWAGTGDKWVQLKLSGNSQFVYNDIEVGLQSTGSSTGVYVQSPTLALTGIRLKWKYEAGQDTKYLGDSWERTYGDAGWKKPASNKNPWYVLLNDGKQTVCFGVKTGCNAICWWTINTGYILS